MIHVNIYCFILVYCHPDFINTIKIYRGCHGQYGLSHGQYGLSHGQYGH
jgi:hypothetical protein